MSNDNNGESNQGSDPALDGLPAGERAETQAILDEIEGDTRKAPEPNPNNPDAKKPDETGKPDEGKPGEDGKKVDGEAGDESGKKNPEGRREVKLMPAYAHEAYKDKTEKQIAKLTEDLAAALAGKAPGATEGNNANGSDADAEAALVKEAQEFADKHGITEELAKDLLARTRQTGLPAELVEKLGKVDQLEAIRETEVETAKFNGDFDRIIAPLVKAEYGDDVPSETLDKIREDLKELAYDPEGTYAKVPYEVIYQGNKQFRELLPAPKRGPESSRPGAAASAAAAGGEAPDLTQSLSDDVIRTLSTAEFETYMENMAKGERSRSSQ